MFLAKICVPFVTVIKIDIQTIGMIISINFFRDFVDICRLILMTFIRIIAFTVQQNGSNIKSAMSVRDAAELPSIVLAIKIQFQSYFAISFEWIRKNEHITMPLARIATHLGTQHSN